MPASRAKSAAIGTSEEVLRHLLDQEAGAQILRTYEKCLAFSNENARRNVQRLFGEAQEMLLRNINEELDKEFFGEGQEWSENLLRETAASRETNIMRYIWQTVLAAYKPRA